MITLSPSLKVEVTGKQAPQVSIDSYLFDKKLNKPSTTNSYEDYRRIRKDATVALVREIAPGPILAANWSFEKEKGVPKKWLTFIKDNILEIRNDFLLQAIRGLNDFGWMPFEKVWYRDSKGYARLKKLKALLHDHTYIMVDDKGSFLGFKQTDFAETVVPLEKSFLLSQDVEGTNWYGTGKLEIVSKIQGHWDDSNDGANRYDKKIAGSHWVVYYPIGVTEVSGAETDNYDLAGTILNALESSGKMRIPASVQSHIQELNADGKSEWKIEAISDNVARQHSFVARLEYLDRLKVRAYGFPEETILKTRYSPSSEQGIHANIVATAQDVQHQYIVSMLNRHVVNQLLRYNFGKNAEGKVYIVPAPITNMSLTFLQDVYKMMMNNQGIVGAEYNNVDIPELRTKIAIPHNGKVTEVTDAINQSPKSVENPLEKGSFKAEDVQN